MPIEKRKYSPPKLKTCPFGEDVLTASGDLVEALDPTWLGGNETTPTAGDFEG